jgi:hypothetical protein
VFFETGFWNVILYIPHIITYQYTAFFKFFNIWVKLSQFDCTWHLICTAV